MTVPIVAWLAIWTSAQRAQYVAVDGGATVLVLLDRMERRPIAGSRDRRLKSNTKAMPPNDHGDHDSYVKSGFSGKVGWGNKPALLLVDVCNAYWSKDSPLDTSENPASAAAPASIAKLVAAAREGQVPLIWTRVEYTEPDMSDAGIFYCKAPLLKVFLKGNETGLERWVLGLEPREDELIVAKRYPSAFFATDLSTRLQLKGIDTLVICGVSTSGCVRASTLDAMCLGYRPIVGLALAFKNNELRSPPRR